MVGAGTRWGAWVEWPFGRSAKRRPSALLVRLPLKLLTRELLGQGGDAIGHTALSFVGMCLFFSKRLHSLRVIVFRVDSFPRASSQRKQVNVVFSRYTGNGPGRRAKCVYGRNIEVISEYTSR